MVPHPNQILFTCADKPFLWYKMQYSKGTVLVNRFMYKLADKLTDVNSYLCIKLADNFYVFAKNNAFKVIPSHFAGRRAIQFSENRQKKNFISFFDSAFQLICPAVPWYFTEIYKFR